MDIGTYFSRVDWRHTGSRIDATLINERFLQFLHNNVGSEEGEGRIEAFMEPPGQYSTDHFLTGIRANILVKPGKAIHQAFRDELLGSE